MLRHVLVGAASFLPALVTLPAMAGVHAPTPASKALEPITLAEANAIGPITQQPEPLPRDVQTEPVQEPKPAASPEQAGSPWAGTLEIYGFAPLRSTTYTSRGPIQRDFPGLRGNRSGDRTTGPLDRRAEGVRGRIPERTLPDKIEIPGFSAVTDVGLPSLLEHLTDIFAIRGSVEYNRIGFQTDLSYVGLGGEAARNIKFSRRFFPDLPVPTRDLNAKVAFTQGIYDFALRYRFGARERPISTPGAVTVIPYAGVRVLDLGFETDTTLEGPLRQSFRNFSFGDPIVQPLLGVQAQVFLAPRLRLFARGDLGGFGANGDVDMSGNAQVGVGYAIGNSTQLDLSWRYLYLARDNGKTPNTAYTIDQNGIELGLKFFF